MSENVVPKPSVEDTLRQWILFLYDGFHAADIDSMEYSDLLEEARDFALGVPAAAAAPEEPTHG